MLSGMTLSTRRQFHLSLLAAGLSAGCTSTSTNTRSLPSAARSTAAPPPAMPFDPSRFVARSYTVNGQRVAVRAFEGLPVVSRPVEPAHQALNLYIPEAYFHGERVGRYTAATAPIFLPNAVGGYMPALPAQPDQRMGPPPPPGTTPPPSAMAVALSRGLVVASPGARGRTQRAADGRWTGKAPAAIVDLKAAVRWLHHHAGQLPAGNTERIISNGTSAGGALSALLGASGNHPDHEAELQAVGALPGRDDIFAVSAYCPITHLEQADGAYEWQFDGLTEYRSIAISMLDYQVQRVETLRQLSPAQLALAPELRAQFVAHVNRLGLRDEQGRPLGLMANGQGSLRDHLQALVMASAQQALASGTDLSGLPWLSLSGGRVVGLDFAAYVRAIGRQKGLPAFDGLALDTGENQLFGDAQTDKRHFTAWAQKHSEVAGASQASPLTVRQMNAMHYALGKEGRAAPHWRIRHGTHDRDTALAIPVLLAAALRERGLKVDLALPWGLGHAGDYDLPALFDWVDERVAMG